MSTYNLSIIIPHRNQSHLLPRLFESILAQKFINLEVIVVDDCSDISCEPVIEAYRSKNLPINLLKYNQRIYTKDARLFGIQAAQSPIIAFADSDDCLTGTEILANHVKIMEEKNADLLHFRSYFTNSQHEFVRYFYVADPWAESLNDKSIFQAFLKGDIHGTCVLWNKLYRKDIFLKFFDHALKSKVRRYVEDLYLMSLYAMHANKYIGSHDVGYAYEYIEKDRKDAAERAVYTYFMRKELPPLLKKLGFSEEIQSKFFFYLTHYISLCAGRLAIAIGHEDGEEISDSTINDLIQLVDIKDLLKTFIISNRMNAQKIVSATRLLRTGIIY